MGLTDTHLLKIKKKSYECITSFQLMSLYYLYFLFLYKRQFKESKAWV